MLSFVPHELRNRTQKRVIKGYLVGYAKNMKAYTIASKTGVRFQAKNIYFNETEMAHDVRKKSVADVIDDRMALRGGNFYDDEDDELEHKQHYGDSDDEKRETTRRSLRQPNPSRANLESLANTPPG